MSVYVKEDPDSLFSCLSSICEQSLLPSEIIIVEDGPLTSDLLKVIEHFRSRLNIVSVKILSNKGLANALNVGLVHCSYELVVRMDSDDYCYPARFEIQVNYMLENPEVACSSCYVEEWDDAFSKLLSIRAVPLTLHAVFDFIRFSSPINHPACIYRKSAILDVGCYPLIYPEDPYLWANLLSKGYIINNIPDRLLKMRAGNSLIRRRGIKFFWGEFLYYRHLYHLGFTSFHLLLIVVFSRFLTRISPPYLRNIIYRNFRPK